MVHDTRALTETVKAIQLYDPKTAEQLKSQQPLYIRAEVERQVRQNPAANEGLAVVVKMLQRQGTETQELVNTVYSLAHELQARLDAVEQKQEQQQAHISKVVEVQSKALDLIGTNSRRLDRVEDWQNQYNNTNSRGAEGSNERWLTIGAVSLTLLLLVYWLISAGSRREAEAYRTALEMNQKQLSYQACLSQPPRQKETRLFFFSWSEPVQPDCSEVLR